MIFLMSGKAVKLQRSRGRTTYYIDSRQGNDSSDGRSARKAWRTLSRVNGVLFSPGDRILFRSGRRWSGHLAPSGSGRRGMPIVIDRYGGRRLPRIDAGGRTASALRLFNVEHWEVRNLEITNFGRAREPRRRGVSVEIEDFGTARHIRLTGLYVHDVNGTNVKDKGGGSGIYWHNRGEKKVSVFDGLAIENCRVTRCDRNGIDSWGYTDRRNWHPSRNVVIRGNLLEDIGGDCILPIGTDGCLVERNVVRGGRRRAKDWAAGIWPWSADNTLFQFNEVSGMKGTRDGQGFDSDYNCRNTIFQYNYSHDNDGGFILICNLGNQEKHLLGNVGITVRYNISQNDSARLFQFSGPTRDTLVHNNVFYTGKKLDLLGIAHNDWWGWSHNVRFFNNIFYAAGKLRHELGASTGNFYAANVFFGNHENPPPGARVIEADPGFVAAGTGRQGLDSLKGYRLKPGSPLIGAGMPVAGGARRDFWGNPLPEDEKALDIGAHQAWLR